MENFNSGWYLVYTRPQHEKKISARLSELKVTSFLPTTRRLRLWNDRKKYLDMPLFPSYVFVFLDHADDFFRTLAVEGVLYFVRSGRQIAKVSNSIVDNIRLLVEKLNDIEVADDRFQPGQPLLICEGPLAGLSCEMIHLNGSQKALVRLSLLKRSLVVTLPRQYLVAATA